MLDRNVSAHKGTMEAMLATTDDYLECDSYRHRANSSRRNPDFLGGGEYVAEWHESRGSQPDIFGEAKWEVAVKYDDQRIETINCCDECLIEELINARASRLDNLTVTPKPRFWVVRSHVVRAYGGAEEGGWHYDRRVIDEVLATSHDRDSMEEFSAATRERFPDPDEEISIVTYVADEPHRLYE